MIDQPTKFDIGHFRHSVLAVPIVSTVKVERPGSIGSLHVHVGSPVDQYVDQTDVPREHRPVDREITTCISCVQSGGIVVEHRHNAVFILFPEHFCKTLSYLGDLMRFSDRCTSRIWCTSSWPRSSAITIGRSCHRLPDL